MHILQASLFAGSTCVLWSFSDRSASRGSSLSPPAPTPLWESLPWVCTLLVQVMYLFPTGEWAQWQASWFQQSIHETQKTRGAQECKLNPVCLKLLLCCLVGHTRYRVNLHSGQQLVANSLQTKSSSQLGHSPFPQSGAGRWVHF